MTKKEKKKEDLICVGFFIPAWAWEFLCEYAKEKGVRPSQIILDQIVKLSGN